MDNVPKAPKKTKKRRRPRDRRPSTQTTLNWTKSGLAVQDQSQWKSRVHWSDKIPKTDAKKQYRLNNDDLIGLAVEKTETYANKAVRPMYLYFERDIERKAWKRHDGPYGLEQYIKKLYASHRKRKCTRPFQYPEPYFKLPPDAPERLLPSSRTCYRGERVGHSPTLFRIQRSLAPWLWDAFNTYLERAMKNFLTRKRRELAMIAAQKFVEKNKYPALPTQLVPSSPAVKRLLSVLKEAPKIDKKQWDDPYLARVYTALDGIVKEHGVGAWETARWAVYNKHYECGHNIMCYVGGIIGWIDHAKHWLDEESFARACSKHVADAPVLAV